MVLPPFYGFVSLAMIGKMAVIYNTRKQMLLIILTAKLRLIAFFKVGVLLDVDRRLYSSINGPIC